MMRVLLVDDEAPARRRVHRLLANIEGVDVVGEASDGFEAIEQVHALAPDLVLLDVEMPELDGFSVVHALAQSDAPSPQIVFLTAYDAYAVRAFEVHALDYLLKPVETERLQRTLARAALARSNAAASFAQFEKRVPPSRGLERLVVSERGRSIVLPLDQVERIEAEQNYVRLFTRDAEFLHRSTITALAAALDAERFARVSRKVIVRVAAIREMRPESHGDGMLVLESGAIVRWSRRYRARAIGPLLSQ